MAEPTLKDSSPIRLQKEDASVSTDSPIQGWSVLIVAHGSPEEKGNVHFRATFCQLAKMLPPEIDLRGGFIEHASPSVSDSISEISQETSGLAMVPYLLFDAGHSKSDLPSYISEAKKRFPSLLVIREWALGTDQILVDILLDILPPADSSLREALILVGRGSLDPNANASFYYQARRLWERRKGVDPLITFIGVTDPRFSQVMADLPAERYDRIIIVPVFLFEGVLMDRIRRQAKEFQLKTGYSGDLTVTPAFGDHPKLLSHMAAKIVRLLRLKKTPMPRWPVVRSEDL